jgi:hypothetical protein
MRDIMTTEKTTGNTIGFPSTEIPAPPAFSMDVPEGWTAAAGTDVLIVLLSPERSTADGGAFRANITADATRVGAAVTFNEIVASSLAHLQATYGNVTVVGSGRTDVDGRPAFAREVEFAVPGGPAVRQFQVIADLGLLSAPHLRSLLNVAATCAVSEADAFRAVVHGVVESVRIS